MSVTDTIDVIVGPVSGAAYDLGTADALAAVAREHAWFIKRFGSLRTALVALACQCEYDHALYKSDILHLLELAKRIRR